MALEIPAEPVPLKRWDDGSIRIGNTRVPLDNLVFALKQGRTATQFAEDFALDLADVYGATQATCATAMR